MLLNITGWLGLFAFVRLRIKSIYCLAVSFSCCLGCSNGSEESEAVLQAAEKGDSKRLAELLSVNAKAINASDSDGRTPLMLASREQHLEVVKLLLEKGAKINQQDDVKATALTFACCGDNPRIVRALIEAGGDIKARSGQADWNLLMFAVWNKKLENVKLLLDFGLEINQVDNRGRTAFHIAKEANYAQVAAYLQSKGGK